MKTASISKRLRWPAVHRLPGARLREVFGPILATEFTSPVILVGDWHAAHVQRSPLSLAYRHRSLPGGRREGTGSRRCELRLGTSVRHARSRRGARGRWTRVVHRQADEINN